MNNPEVTMHDLQQSTRFDALEKATTAAGIAISLVIRVPNSVSSTRFRLGSQERALRECPSRALLGPDVREEPMRECPQQRRERHVRSTPGPRVVN